MEDAQKNVNTHIFLEFDRCDTWFLVQEIINPREVRLAKNFMVRLDERLWQILKGAHALFSCYRCFKHVHQEYRNYIHLVYTLESVFEMYK